MRGRARTARPPVRMAAAGDPDSQFAAAWPQDRSLCAPVASVSIKALTTQIRGYGVVHGRPVMTWS